MDSSSKSFVFFRLAGPVNPLRQFCPAGTIVDYYFHEQVHGSWLSYAFTWLRQYTTEQCVISNQSSGLCCLYKQKPRTTFDSIVQKEDCLSPEKNSPT
ncbi:hypothetical protein J7438_18275 [Thalassotalea sp. G20_0]|uniref:hypothetical protein n=1 Tax=Thalassotalea sp. G20_0 TaxID=2821093 RepID=UPI001ADD347B|nr:hypothetical protein [Thalassotalea sp. G20_0]MBO9496011.1 hypothetical protein [Thalassotalea sp. G20_0]